MALATVTFQKRLRRIVKNHQRMANGVTHKIDENGLIVARPRIYNPKFPLRGLILLICTAFLFKGYVLSSLGAETYGERLVSLQNGTLLEQAGAWIMQPDAFTQAIAQVLQSVGL